MWNASVKSLRKKGIFLLMSSMRPPQNLKRQGKGGISTILSFDEMIIVTIIQVPINTNTNSDRVKWGVTP